MRTLLLCVIFIAIMYFNIISVNIQESIYKKKALYFLRANSGRRKIKEQETSRQNRKVPFLLKSVLPAKHPGYSRRRHGSRRGTVPFHRRGSLWYLREGCCTPHKRRYPLPFPCSSRGTLPGGYGCRVHSLRGRFWHNPARDVQDKRIHPDSSRW